MLNRYTAVALLDLLVWEDSFINNVRNKLLLFHATVFNNFHFSQEMTFNSRNEIKSNTGKTIIYKQTISLAF